ncbi:hypothetical protein [Rhizobium sp. MHM7A]|uniref:hypothetical protein n=1 Tax=Rhizobium sp. MHM7A TaxID=2583233 RepID=UPI0011068217|nr:hypothetical protein [Rhizobium sp. MHM7A]TLX16056.1 hypothetical protein FFR93_01680 [Rhizobium sp. MHM7A]
MKISFTPRDGITHDFTTFEEMATCVSEKLPVRIVIEDDGRTLSDVSLTHCPEAEDFLEAVLWTTPEGSAPDDKYTQGDCDVFAITLQRLLPDGRLIAVYDPVDPFTGRKMRGAPYLIHAGLLLDDMVLDIRGAREKFDWITAHRENGDASDLWGWREVSITDLEKMQKSKITEAEITEAMPYARLVHITCSVTDKELELPVPTF